MFLRARDLEALLQGYEQHLGFTEEGPELPLRQPGLGRTVCRDLDAMLAQLRTAGVDVSERIEEYSYGRFGWAHDLGGNRFELWEPL